MSIKASAKGVGRGKDVTAAGHGLSTLVDALAAPQLAHACYNSDVLDFDPEQGLKGLRLVSKTVKEVLQRMLRAYTMQLGAEDQPDLPVVVEFLKSIDLLRLKFVFSTLAETGEPATITL